MSDYDIESDILLLVAMGEHDKRVASEYLKLLGTKGAFQTGAIRRVDRAITRDRGRAGLRRIQRLADKEANQ